MLRYQGDLAELMLATAEGRLGTPPAPRFADQTALTVVMAAEGYPGTPKKGGAIHGVSEAEATGAKVFHAGTALEDGQLVANGGRVLNVTAMAGSVGAAQQAVYEAVKKIDFPDGFCRKDIGWREVKREAMRQ
jgi:phosphoribosylamine---glycine ligase